MEVSTRFGLAELLVVANTRHGPGGHHHARARHDGPDHDHLRDPRDARAFLADHAMPVPPGLPSREDLRRLRALRETVRGRVERPDVAVQRRLPRSRGGYRVDATGRLRAEATGWAGVVDDLRLPLLELTTQPGADGLKRCGNPLCRWVFVDRSRNRSRRWCDMAACGNRAKVARHRRLARAG